MEGFMKSRIAQVEVIPIRAPRKEAVRSGLNPNDPVSASEFGVIRIADESGITLVGLLRGQTANVYSHPERIT